VKKMRKQAVNKKAKATKPPAGNTCGCGCLPVAKK
jgi:hypothetical protein